MIKELLLRAEGFFIKSYQRVQLHISKLHGIWSSQNYNDVTHDFSLNEPKMKVICKIILSNVGFRL